MTAFASNFGLPAELEGPLRDLGVSLSPEAIDATRAIFAGRHPPPIDIPGATLDRDTSYGAHPRQVLDVWRRTDAPAPIVLFVPGGGFSTGSKGLYAHIPAYFARRGLVAAALDYRLAPDHAWPAGSEDVAAALDWLHDHAQELGGDPEQIFLIAQSAGAAHASGALFLPRLQPRCIEQIQTAVLMSGLYSLSPGPIGANAPLYFGEDPSLYPDRSPAAHVQGSKTPIVMTYAEWDPDYLGVSSAALFSALTLRDGHAPAFAWLRGHTHLSPVLNFAAPGDELADAIFDEMTRSKERLHGA